MIKTIYLMLMSFLFTGLTEIGKIREKFTGKVIKAITIIRKGAEGMMKKLAALMAKGLMIGLPLPTRGDNNSQLKMPMNSNKQHQDALNENGWMLRGGKMFPVDIVNTLTGNVNINLNYAMGLAI